MFGALRLVSIEQGYDPRNFALIAFGGAGPVHANALGKLLGSWPVIIPPSPGVLCAYGDATTQIRNEAAKTLIARLDDLSPGEVVRELESLKDKAASFIEAEGIDAAKRKTLYQVDLRYSGQGFEVPVNVDMADLRSRGFASIKEAFDSVHNQLFTFTLDLPHELVNLRAIVEEIEQEVQTTELPEGGEDAGAALSRTSDTFWYEGKNYRANIYDRLKLACGNKIQGPAIVAEMDSTTVILPGYTGIVDRFGNILINPLKK
jgi:N-methylhydantoinase A